jgi:DNA-binding NtrC family response regulator
MTQLSVNSAPHKSLVIVDDDISYTSLLTQLLEEHLGCRVFSFSRPREALAALPGLDPGVIVTDYEMPGLNGFEFMAEAVHLAPQTPFILITGHPINDVMHKLIDASPVKAVVPKPFNWRQLTDEISRLWPETGATLIKAGAASA